MKHKNEHSTVYTPGLPMRLFVLAIGLMMAGIHAVVLRGIGFSGGDWTPLLFFVPILMLDAWLVWYGLLFTTQTHVNVSEAGIELQRGGARHFASWDNISHFGVRGAGKNQQQGIYLYHKVQPNVTGIAEKLFFGRQTDFIPIGQVINLPRRFGFFKARIDLDKLAATDFGRDVAYYAPHLLVRRRGQTQTRYRQALRETQAGNVLHRLRRANPATTSAERICVWLMRSENRVRCYHFCRR